VPALHAHRRQGVKEGQEPWSEGACVIGPEGKAGLEAQPARFAWRGKTQRYPWMPGRGAGIDRRRRGTRRRGNRYAAGDKQPERGEGENSVPLEPSPAA
jgi:hypothetical protein